MPAGFASKQAVMEGIASGKVPIIDKSDPDPASVGVTVTRGIEYGKVGERSLQLDLYTLPNLTKPVPALIFIHGGGWVSGDRRDYQCYAARYAKRGYVVASISYRFSKEALFPACVQDTKCAVRWMRANAAANHVDPNRIAVIGGSAGGYLALMAGYTSDVPEFEGEGGNAGVSSAVQAVVDLYGPTDFVAPEANDAPPVKGLLGKTLAEDPELFKKASPVTYVKAGCPPTLIFQGSIDDVVMKSQSDALAEKLKGAGVPYEYEVFEGWPHTMDLAKDVNIRCQWFLTRFLKTYLPDPAN